MANLSQLVGDVGRYSEVEQSNLDALSTAAVESAFHGIQNEASTELDAVLEMTTDPSELTRLLLDRSVVRQVADDPGPSARDALDAVEASADAGDPALRAAACAIASGFVLRTGDLGQSIDLAVASMAILSERREEKFGNSELRAFNALSVLFSRLAAFELAVDAARSASAIEAPSVNASTRSIVAYNLCSCALERLRAPECGPDETERLVGEIETAIACLCDEESSDTARLLVGPGMRAELAILGHANPSAIEELETFDISTVDAPPQMLAWHRLVRSLVARTRGDLDLAAVLLDDALVTLKLPAAEEHNLLRAMRQRAELRRLIGDFEGAANDLATIVERLHRAQLAQVGRLSSQIQHRVDGEIARAEVRQEAASLAQQMAVDELTGVGSRRWLERRMEELVGSGMSGAVIMVDLDHFKAINDTHGHAVGDRVLSSVGSVLLGCVRPDDLVARFGGEEFLMILPETSVDTAIERGERIAEGLRELAWSEDGAESIRLTASAGVSAGPFSELADMIEIADQRLYLAKRAGRDRIVSVSAAA